MRRRRIFFTMCLTAFLAGACDLGNEDSEFTPVSFDISGVQLKNSVNVISFSGEVTGEAHEIIFRAKGKYKENGMLNEYMLNGDWCAVPHDATVPFIAAENAWCKIEVIDTNPHTTRLTFAANKTSAERCVKLYFGSGYICAEVEITQLKGTAVSD